MKILFDDGTYLEVSHNETKQKVDWIFPKRWAEEFVLSEAIKPMKGRILKMKYIHEDGSIEQFMFPSAVKEIQRDGNVKFEQVKR